MAAAAALSPGESLAEAVTAVCRATNSWTLLLRSGPEAPRPNTTWGQWGRWGICRSQVGKQHEDLILVFGVRPESEVFLKLVDCFLGHRRVGVRFVGRLHRQVVVTQGMFWEEGCALLELPVSTIALVRLGRRDPFLVESLSGSETFVGGQ